MSSPSAETALENEVIGNDLPLTFKVRKYSIIVLFMCVGFFLCTDRDYFIMCAHKNINL